MTDELQQLQYDVATLKKKLENVQNSMYCDIVDANMSNRRLKHALWSSIRRRAIAEIAVCLLEIRLVENINFAASDKIRPIYEHKNQIWEKCLKLANKKLALYE